MKERSNIVIDQSWYEKPDGIAERFSCGGVVCRVNESEEILILLTFEKDDRCFVLPKGGKEIGELDLDTAIREVGEEAGINDLTLLADLGNLQRLSFAKNAWSNTHFFLFYTQQINGTPTDEEHFHKPSWFSLEDNNPYFWPDQKDLIKNNRHRITDLILKHHRQHLCLGEGLERR